MNLEVAIAEGEIPKRVSHLVFKTWIRVEQAHQAIAEIHTLAAHKYARERGVGPDERVTIFVISRPESVTPVAAHYCTKFILSLTTEH